VETIGANSSVSKRMRRHSVQLADSSQGVSTEKIPKCEYVKM
jgi:hypothetical protein